MHFLAFRTIKTIEIMDGSCEITRRSDVTSSKPCNITVCPVFCNVTSGETMPHVIISAKVDRHMSQSEDVHL